MKKDNDFDTEFSSSGFSLIKIKTEGNKKKIDFDTSIILPFYRKLEEFKKAITLNANYFARMGIEVIIVLDDAIDEHNLNILLSSYPKINWKVIINRVKHSWRNPSKVINVGIRHSEKKYILVMSPESEFKTDVILQMYSLLQSYDKYFVIGQVAFSSWQKSEDIVQLFPYGSIMTKKIYFNSIRGYDEQLNKWGGDDDNVRARLEFIGVRKMLCNDILLIHKEEEVARKSRENKGERIQLIDKMRLLYPNTELVNDETWGTDFNENLTLTKNIL